MGSDFIRVAWRHESVWTVLRGPRGLCLLTFKIKSHAVAYARAVSFSGNLTLFIDDGNGTAIRQSSSSLTYPIVLN